MEQDCSFNGGQEGRMGGEEQRKWEEERKGREMNTNKITLQKYTRYGLLSPTTHCLLKFTLPPNGLFSYDSVRFCVMRLVYSWYNRFLLVSCLNTISLGTKL